jgi:hypothetical protein
MKTIEVNKIDLESYQKVNDFICSNEWNIWVIINSRWWETWYWQLIVWMLNMNAHRITLILSSWCYSSAFTIFHDYKWKRIMMYWSMWMWHQAYQTISINESWTTTYQGEWYIVKNNKETFTKPYEWMTKKEKRDYMKWKDVYFTFSRMQEIFPDVEIVK